MRIYWDPSLSASLSLSLSLSRFLNPQPWRCAATATGCDCENLCPISLPIRRGLVLRDPIEKRYRGAMIPSTHRSQSSRASSSHTLCMFHVARRPPWPCDLAFTRPSPRSSPSPYPLMYPCHVSAPVSAAQRPRHYPRARGAPAAGAHPAGLHPHGAPSLRHRYDPIRSLPHSTPTFSPRTLSLSKPNSPRP